MFCTGLFLGSAVAPHAAALRLQRPPAGTALADDPPAPAGPSVAVRIREEPGAAVMRFAWPDAAPGLYRVSLPLRLHPHPKFDSARLRMTLAFSAGKDTWLAVPVSPAQLDGTPGAWTVLDRPVSLRGPSTDNRLSVSWSFAADMEAVRTGKTGKSAFEIELPDVSEIEPLDAQSPGGEQSPDLLEQIHSDSPRPPAEIDYPAILVGHPVIDPVTTTLAVGKVWPEKVHVYPGEASPVEVTVRNFSASDAEALVSLVMEAGLDETAPVGETRLRVPAGGTAKASFAWTAGTREYGHAAVATVSVGGKAVHSATEYFSVSTPIWKTAIQGSGFLTWYGREKFFAEHVDYNRRVYVNVEEAFSWQPSSWTDLNPTNETWWSGQNDFHNSLSGLREWMARSHSNGIKMITYSWPAASGKPGFDLGRRFPDILCREKGGIPGTDNEDLALRGITESRPELWRYRSGQWLSNYINMGLLRAIDHHAREVIRSSRNFGWDGLRFDGPPGWSAMGTADVHREFEMLGVTNLMKGLMPEQYDSTNSVWDGQAISIRNVRYFRHVFAEELGPDFALSYNAGGLEPVTGKDEWWRREMCGGGGQVMNEAIRNMGSLSNYMDVAWWHSEAIRKAGGYSCVFMAERCSAPLAGAYSAIFTFASGTHPYGDYGWSRPMPGNYTQFMTRYGEYCWDPELTPAGPDHAGVSVESEMPLLWERYVRQRHDSGVLQTVVHLITQPEWVPEAAAAQTQVRWSRDVEVRKPCRSEPSVWMLTAEPEPAAVLLPAKPRGDAFVVTVPELRCWSILVWSEQP